MQMTPLDIDALLSSLEKRSFNSTLFNLAHAYARASDKSWSAIISENDADFIAPAIMCQSFAIELLLKFFIVIDHLNAQTKADFDALGINLKGHRYSALWDQITPSHKKNIAESFSNISGQLTNESEFREILVQIGDDPFVFWRYIYEKNGTNSFDKPLFDKVTDAIGKTAESERKRVSVHKF